MSSGPSSSIRITGVALTVIVCALLLQGCSSQATSPVQKDGDAGPGIGAGGSGTGKLPSVRTTGEKAAVIAVRQVGVPYRYGGTGADGFDCSGLVQYAWSAVGKKLPRTTGELWQQMQPVLGHELQVGDVLFFNIEGKVSHVGLYLGSRRFVHAPSSGREVTVAALDSEFYRNAFIRGGRPRLEQGRSKKPVLPAIRSGRLFAHDKKL